MLSRRSLLRSAGLFLFLFLSGERQAMAQFFSKPKASREPRTRDNLFTEGGKSLVGISGGRSPEGMIREAVSLIGGFGKLEIKGRTVLVKPNVVSGEKNPATTNPEVVGALVRILYGEGAKKVYVGDMSAFRTISTRRNMGRNGIKRAAEENGAEVIIFEDYGWIKVPLPGTKYVKEAHVTEWIFRPDIIINLPVIKTHRSATYSITLKNFIGCTHLRQRPYLIDAPHWEEIISEFNAAYTPELNIVDGTVSMIEGGPWEGTPERTDIIIASGDRVAADIIGLGLIRSFGKWEMVTSKPVWEQTQIKTAVELGIGKGKGGIKLVAGKGGGEFDRLMGKIREETGL